MSSYKFGTTYPPTAIDQLSPAMPEPFPTEFQEFDIVRVAGTGQPIGNGFSSAEWHFDVLTVAQLEYWIQNGGQQIYVTTRTDEGSPYSSQFGTFTGFLDIVKNSDYKQALGRLYYQDVTIRFISLEAYP